MDERTRTFLQSNFSRYYGDLMKTSAPSVTTDRVAESGMPEVVSMESREFGFINLEKPFPGDVVMHRHRAYASMDGLFDRFASQPPAHVYLSAARFRDPSARRMNEKGWTGADLVFDLDMDHLREAPETFPEMLLAVREETVKLVEEFLLGDLSVPVEEMQIAFSGGRGYHVHVRQEGYLGLGSRERREIVDYVKGRVSPDVYLKKGRTGRLSPEEPGWAGRLNLSLGRLLGELGDAEDSTEAVREVVENHSDDARLGEKRAAAVLESVSNLERGYFNPGKVTEESRVALVKEAALRAGADIDEPVTSDTHRLIRLPGSLHGGSGLRVTPLSVDELRDFSPLEDAVAFNDDPVLVEGKEDSPPFLRNVSLRGEEHGLGQGEEAELPRHAAVFMALRGGAEVK